MSFKPAAAELPRTDLDLCNLTWLYWAKEYVTRSNGILRSMCFNNSQIVISGAASGIGLATAQLLARRGAVLSLSDINKKGLDAALRSLDGKGHSGTVVDVRNYSEVDSWIDGSCNRLGGLDGAANVAGVEHEGGRYLAEARNEDWDLVMGTNCAGVFYSMRAELRKMLNVGGSIVSVYLEL